MRGCPCRTASAGTPYDAASAPAASRRCGWPTTSSSTRRWRSRCSPTTGPRTTSPAAVPRGGPLPAQGRVPARRLGLRRRRARRRAPLPGHVLRRPGHPRGPARRRRADDGAGDGGGPPGRRRTPGAARPRHPAPRHQAGQRAVPQRRRLRCARRPRDGRRPRPRQVAGHVLAAHDDRRDADVRRPRAGLGPVARRPRRPVLARGAGLPAAHRPPAVHPHLAVRRDEPRHGATGLDAGTAVRAGRRAGAAPRAGPGPRRPLPERHRVRRRARVGPRSGRHRAVDPAVARPRPRADPARSASHRRSPTRATCPSRPCRVAGAGGSRCSRLVGLLALAVGGGAGYAAQRELAPTERTISDATGTLSVTVPSDWDRADASDGWTPPDTDSALPALSVGTSTDWATEDATARESSSPC